MSLLPHVDEIVYADGNSTDGTLKLLEYIQKTYAGDKLRILRGWDCENLTTDYVRLFNATMKECKGDYLLYSHPDMLLTKPGKLSSLSSATWAYYVNMRSFAGEDLEMEIVKGRTNKWKTLMKNDFGLHYWGVYGDTHEDMYFKDITGDEHKVYKDMGRYPFPVEDSGVEMWHFCECKPRKRREEKMLNILEATGVLEKPTLGKTMPYGARVFDVIANHPRIHLRNQKGIYGEFEFVERKDALPEVFAKYKEEFEEVLKTKGEK